MSQLNLFQTENLNTKLIQQKRIVSECIRTGKDFHRILEEINWNYDDLQYEINNRPYSNYSRYFTLNDFRNKNNSIPIVSFFSGAGGLDLGFEAAGFEHLALIEKNKLFCDTLRFNRPHWNIIGPPNYAGDVSNLEEIAHTLRPLIGAAPFDGIFIGGPPCQPFSIAANQRFNKKGDNFKRIGFAHETNGNLLFDYIELIKKFKPAAFVIENVPGLIDVDSGEQIQRIYGELESLGYTLDEPLLIIAAEHHVPQNRIRLFIVGNRLGKPYTPPKPIGKQLPCGCVFELPVNNVENQITRKHSAESIERYMKLNFGSRDKLGRVDRLDPSLPSKTVIAGGVAGGGRSHLHPYIPRTLSVRESARLQTFPDNYVFQGPVARQFTQVGNAVPPVLAAQLAHAMHISFFS